MLRALLWFFLTFNRFGFALSALIFIRVFLFPSGPGAKMELMAVPCLATPMAACGLGAIVLAYADDGTSFKRREKLSAWIAGGLTMIVFGTLAVLG